jgi:hypothetical protein
MELYSGASILPVSEIFNDGMYHIPFALLDSTIPNLTSINPADFVMYHNGTAVPITCPPQVLRSGVRFYRVLWQEEYQAM